MSSLIEHASEVDIPLERDLFLRTLIRELSGTLEDVVGVKDAAGFISVVGQNIGDELNAAYTAGLGLEKLNQAQVVEVLVDLKRRIRGDFYVIEQTPQKVILGNRACPFGDKVVNRPSMCMMTSNVFGVIAAENLGYARIDLQETIATGNAECRVVVHFEPDSEAGTAQGREYFQIQH